MQASNPKPGTAWGCPADGSTATTPELTRTFSGSGELPLKLTVRDAQGETRLATLTLTLGPWPDLGGVRCEQPARAGWCRLNGEPREDIHFVDAWRGYAVGAGSRLLRTSDGGRTWEDMPALPGSQGIEQLSSVRFADAARGWVIGTQLTNASLTNGYRTVVFRTTDGGTTWQATELGATALKLPQLTALDPQRVLVSVGTQFDLTPAVPAAGVTQLGSVDGGVTWSPPTVTCPSPTTCSSAIETPEFPLGLGKFAATGASASGVLWGLASGAVVRSADAGLTRTTPSAYGPYIAVSMLPNDREGWALATDGAVWRTRDQAATWERLGASGLAGGLGSDSVRLVFVDAQVGWLAAFYANTLRVLRTRDGGSTWTELNMPTGTNDVSHPAWFEARSAQVARLRVLGDYQGSNHMPVSLMTLDGGATWTTEALGRAAWAWPPGASEVLVETEDGGWVRNATGARSGTPIFAGSPLTGREPNSPNMLMALSPFFRLTAATLEVDGNWRVMGSDFPYSPTQLSSTDQGRSWRRSWQDRSPTWDNFGTAGLCRNARLTLNAAGRGWMALSAWGYARTVDGGKTLTLPSRPPTVDTCRFDFDMAGTGDTWHVAWMAAGPSGAGSYLRRSTNHGDSWSALIAMPFEVLGLRFADASTGIAVGAGGRIARTTDGGLTWAMPTSVTSQDLTQVHWIDGQRAIALGRDGAVAWSGDGGARWQLATVPASQRFAVDGEASATVQNGQGGKSAVAFADGLNGWIAAPGGALLNTTDGGLNWTLQSGSGPRTPLAMTASSASAVRLLGADGVLYGSETGGR